jgi:SAM-dependent methyltransferase
MTPMRLFSTFDPSQALTPAAAEFYDLLGLMREAARREDPPWTSYPTFVEYTRVCHWAIRKREYGFLTEAFARAESEEGRPLAVLDAGCGVVPLCNWMSRRGHAVTAVDPLADDIDFLTGNDLNGFYGSSVDYRQAHCEALPFDDAQFDVVLCASVLEHIVPGNDRLALWEMARVLRPGGRLLLTFDVAPPAPPQPGEIAWPAHLRRHASPFAPEEARRLLGFLGPAFGVTLADLPAELDQLTWEQVFAFWKAHHEHDARSEPVRRYLALGTVLIRTAEPVRPTASEVRAAFLEGDAALHERLGYFQLHAAERLRVIDDLQESLRVRGHDREVVEQHLQGLNEQLLGLREHLHGLHEQLLGQRDHLQGVRAQMGDLHAQVSELRGGWLVRAARRLSCLAGRAPAEANSC